VPDLRRHQGRLVSIAGFSGAGVERDGQTPPVHTRDWNVLPAFWVLPAPFPIGSRTRR
jgi:hypothetical protein